MPVMIAIKPLLLLVAWLGGAGLAVYAVFAVFAPYLVSVVANIGRRPIVLHPRTPPRWVVRRHGLTAR